MSPPVAERMGVAQGDPDVAADRFFSERKWPLLAAAVLVVSGLAYFFFWGPVVRHQTGWVQPGDLWGTFRAAQYIGWGDVSDIYTSGTGFISFPGIAVALAPIAYIATHLGLSNSYPYALPKPTGFVLLGPFSLLIGTLPIFALDAIMRFLGRSRNRRIVLCAGQVVFLWPMLVIWGHPEDALALGFALYGLLAAWKGDWAKSGWLFGVGLAFQPAVILMVPIVLALFPSTRGRLYGLVRMGIPSVLVLAIPLVQSWGATTYALVKQPTFPLVDHPTPLLTFAPVIGHIRAGSRFAFVHEATGARFVTFGDGATGPIVSPGPGRVVAVALAVALGIWVWRRRPEPQGVLWLCALAFSGWCALEAVMTPYYPWPALALVLAAASQAPRWRLGTVMAAGVLVSIWDEHYFSPWVYYGPIMVALVVALVCAWPGSISRSPASQPAVPPALDQTDPEPIRTAGAPPGVPLSE